MPPRGSKIKTTEGTLAAENEAKEKNPIDPKQWKLPSNFNDLVSGTETYNDSDIQKYDLAYKLAQEKNRDNDKVTKRQFKQDIDDIYSQMNPSVSSSDLRGENFVTQRIEDAKNIFEDINNGIGGFIDSAFDTVVGGIGDGVDALLKVDKKDSWGDKARNLFTGEQAAVIPDIIEDILIGAIPYAGIPLVMAKNAIQRSDQIYEGLTGRDSITKEKLSDNEVVGKLGEAALGTMLAAIPGIGKASKAIKGGLDASEAVAKGATAAKDLSKVGKNAAKEVAEDATKVSDDIAKTTVRKAEDGSLIATPAEKTIEEAGKVANNVADETGKTVEKAVEEIAENSSDAVEATAKLRSIDNALENAKKFINNPYESIKDALQRNTVKRFEEGINKYKDNLIKKAEKKGVDPKDPNAMREFLAGLNNMKDMPMLSRDQLGNAFANIAIGLPLGATDMALAEMGATGKDFSDALDATAARDGAVGFYTVAPFLFPAGKVSSLNRNAINGLSQSTVKYAHPNRGARNTIGNRLGYQGQRASALGLTEGDLAESDKINGYTLDPEYVEQLIGRLKK